MGTATLVVACLTLAVASVTLFLMGYWRRPRLKVCVRSAAPVTRLRRFDTGGKRIKGNVVFEVAIYNKSYTTSNVEDVKAYEVTHDGALHRIGGGFYIGQVGVGRPDTRFDIPGRGRQILNYSGDGVELQEWREFYVFRVRVSDSHKKDWDGDIEVREVKKE